MKSLFLFFLRLILKNLSLGCGNNQDITQFIPHGIIIQETAAYEFLSFVEKSLLPLRTDLTGRLTSRRWVEATFSASSP